MKNTCFILAFVLASLALSSAVAESNSKLILGFETEELVANKSRSWSQMKRLEDGCDFWANFEFGVGDRAWTWQCRTGDSTEGTQVLVGRAQPGAAQTTFLQTAFQQRYYPVLHKNAAEASVILNTFQWLAYANPTLRDWSDYDLLWVDFKTDKLLKVWLTLEDEAIEPPVVRIFEVPADKWVTLELDLKAAQRIRGLDLTQIANIYLFGKAVKTTDVRVDNVRVVGKGASSKLEVLRDSTVMKAPAVEFGSKPVVAKLSKDYKPDRSEVKLEPAKKIADGSVVPFGWIGAADNQHIIVGYTQGKERPYTAVITESADAGKSWSALPAPVARNFDHGTSRGSVVDGRGDSVAISSGPGCAGIGVTTPRQHLTKYTFTGNGWQRRRWANILDYDIRHCGSAASVIRLDAGPKKGRLWATWGSVDRLRRLVVGCRFSDDDGQTWWQIGKSAMVPDSAETPFAFNSYSYQQPRITYFRGHAAVFWQDSRGLLWSRFDGEKWSEAEVISAEVKANVAVSPNESFRIPGSVVTRGEDEIFLTAWGLRGVLRYDGNSWHRELTKAADAGVLTICGKKDVMLITMGSTEQPPSTKRIQIKRKAKVLCYRRKRDGTWAAPLDLAGGEVTLHEYRQMTAVVTQPMSPANFAPVAFSDGETVKIIKVPVLEK
ncbi:MAG: sialidase family protein [Planctomycetota bacterium]|jgi:hypothetical protein